jgi:type I restriction enzyme, S subunit
VTTEWECVPLGELCSIVSGGTPPRSERAHFGGGVPWVKISDMLEGEITTTEETLSSSGLAASAAKVLPKDTILLSIFATIGRTATLKVDAATNQAIAGITPQDHRVEGTFLRRFLETAAPRLAQQSRGVAQSNINLSILRSLPVPLPPIEEQRRIAAVLKKADSLQAKRKASIALLDSIIDSVFLSMFGDPVLNPAGWPLMPFAEVCDTRLGKMLDQKRQSGEHRRLYLRNANVRWFEFDLSDVAEMDFDASDRVEFRVEPGDLLICEGGEPGRAAVWRGEVAEIYFQKALHRGRPDPSKATPTYLVYLLWHLARRGGLVDHISSATIAHLTGVRLKTMKVPVPDLDLQHEFGRRLAAVDRCRSHLMRSAGDLRAVFASLEARAFSGQL